MEIEFTITLLVNKILLINSFDSHIISILNILHKNTAARKKSAHAKALAKAGSALAPVAMPKSARATPAKKASAPKKSTTTEKAPAKAKAPAAAKKAPAKKTK